MIQTRTIPLALMMGVVMVWGQNAANGKKLRPSEKSTLGRFQILNTQSKTLKLDTATGDTWFLDTDGVWKPVLEKDTTIAAEPGPNKTYILVLKPAEASDVVDHIRALSGVISIRRVDSRDPLGLFSDKER